MTIVIIVVACRSRRARRGISTREHEYVTRSIVATATVIAITAVIATARMTAATVVAHADITVTIAANTLRRSVEEVAPSVITAARITATATTV